MYPATAMLLKTSALRTIDAAYHAVSIEGLGCRFVVRIGGGLVAGLVRLYRGLGFFRTLLGCGGNLFGALLAGDRYVVCDLLGRHRHLLRAFLRRVRHGFGVALD